MNDTVVKAFQEFSGRYALRKMRKQEKRLKKYAMIYFGEPVAIVYAWNGTKVIHSNGAESEVSVP